MQPNSTKDPGQISIQKLNEAREMVTITKQRRHVFLVGTKRDSGRFGDRRFGDNIAADVSATKVSPKRLCNRNVL